ncbi:flavin reductase family protein [Aurantiacibacter gangjinensis]|uniref:Uncharacterized protein n=1 Tax=Aurantiacibacter gangjinensis TaxID=502682 RepID=A0A0G9MQJ9_9SPHN|nr:flavin reductase family protein [Aurantiacibacter gangjinensis]APE28675.1 putative flavin reductase RutF [Aurantiacibacter gangjinensis]KLE32844.1 hypothetical protein AAW01_02125 [Aurantiacibacter gangjinensis]
MHGVGHSELVENFRDAMRHVAATVYAVTTMDAGQRYGILATAVSSLSFEPPSLLVCVNRTASLHDPMERAERFCVNVLGLGNRDVAERFMLPRPDRFGVGEWVDEHEVPVLATAQSSLICKTAHRQVFGTHTIFIGELLAANHRDDATPLTYFDRDYIDISKAPQRDPDA